MVNAVLNSADIAAAGGVLLSQTQSFSVGPTGDFLTLQAAMTALNSQFLEAQYFTTLTLEDGVHTYTDPVDIFTGFGRQILIQGLHTYAKTVSSVQSSSGSAGAYSVILNVNSVANIAVGDYAVISAPSGGTNPTYLAGAHEVTNVDAVNTRITVASKHRAAAAPSGAVIATVTVLKSIVKFNGCHGFRIWNGSTAINLNNFAVVGDGTASMWGVLCDDVGRCYVGDLLAVCGFGGRGFSCIQNAQMNSDGLLVASGNQTGFAASLGGSINSNIIASGNSIDGVSGDLGGVVYSGGGTASISTGNGSVGWHATKGAVVAVASTQATGNGTWGYYSESQGYVDATSVTTANNVTGASQVLFQATGATLAGSSSTTGSFTVGASNSVAFSGRTRLQSPANGVTNPLTSSGTPLTYADLPTVGTAGAGAFAYISDCNTTTFNAIAAGGGSNGLRVTCDGTNWRVG